MGVIILVYFCPIVFEAKPVFQDIPFVLHPNGVLSGWLIFSLIQGNRQVSDNARNNAVQQAVDAALEISLVLDTVPNLEDLLSQEISSGQLAEEDIEPRLLSLLEANPPISAIIACFSPQHLPDFVIAVVMTGTAHSLTPKITETYSSNGLRMPKITRNRMGAAIPLESPLTLLGTTGLLAKDQCGANHIWGLPPEFTGADTERLFTNL